jgi:putative FmdB family regulatory protein
MRGARKFGDAAMPLFAYRCRSCGEAFQTLVMSGETPVCKACESADLEQQLSLIAAPAKGGDEAPPMAARCEAAEAGMCCGGACGMAA